MSGDPASVEADFPGGGSPVEADAADYLQVYLDEGDEGLDGVVAALLRLEGDAADAEALDEAFRLLHTLKGSAGMMGFEPVGELAHALESRLETFRGGRPLDRATMDVVLEGVDFFRAYHGRLRGGEVPEADASRLIAKAEALSDGPPDATPSREGDPLTGGASLADRSAGTLAAEGAYRVRVAFEAGLQLADLKARLVVTRLAQVGEIVATDPPVDDVRSVDDLAGLAVVVLSDRGRDELRSLADVDGVREVEIEGGALTDVAAGGGRDAEPPPAPSSAPSILDPPPGAAHPADVDTAVPAPPPEPPAPKPASPEPPAAEPADDPKKPAKPTVVETVRVEIDRLDRLMNLTGELVVTRARLATLAEGLDGVFKRAAGGRGAGSALEDAVAEARRSSDDPAALERALARVQAASERVRARASAWDDARGRAAAVAEAVDRLGRVCEGLQDGVLKTRMVPVAPLLNHFRRVVRDLSADRGKEVRLVIEGESTELDKRMVDELGDPLIHLVRNALDHGVETPDERRAAGKPPEATVTLSASHSGSNVFLRVTDDGRGIDTARLRSKAVERGLATAAAAASMGEAEALELIWHPGLSTAEAVTDVSGRGVGMDVVRSRIQGLSGTVEAATEPGRGTVFTVRLPLTLAIVRALLVRVRGTAFSVPIEEVREIVSVPSAEVRSAHGSRTVDVRGEFVPVARLHEVFGGDAPPGRPPAKTDIVVLQSGGRSLGLCVDELLGGDDVVIKSLAENFEEVRGLSGASVTGEGDVCLMLDVAEVLSMAGGRS